LATSEFNQKKPFSRKSVNPALPRIPAQSQKIILHRELADLALQFGDAAGVV
jgi:hypothetical protein